MYAGTEVQYGVRQIFLLFCFSVFAQKRYRVVVSRTHLFFRLFLIPATLSNIVVCRVVFL